MAEEGDCMNPGSKIEKSCRSGLEHMNDVRKSEVISFRVKTAVMTESEESRSSKFTAGTHIHDQLYREIT